MHLVVVLGILLVSLLPVIVGLSGGTTSGDATLSLGFETLTSINRTQIAEDDYFVLRDNSAGNAPYRTVTKNVLALTLSDDITLDVNNSTIRIAPGGVDTTQLADESVTEDKLDIGNTPTLSQLLSWDGSGLLWATSTGGGSSTFLDLTDTPTLFGTAAQIVRINAGADGLEFITSGIPYDWATEGNTDDIPLNKLGNAPSGTNGIDGVSPTTELFWSGDLDFATAFLFLAAPADLDVLPTNYTKLFINFGRASSGATHIPDSVSAVIFKEQIDGLTAAAAPDTIS